MHSLMNCGIRKPFLLLKAAVLPRRQAPERVSGARLGSSRGSKGAKRGAGTRLLPDSAKGVRRVERRGKTAGPVAGRRNVYPNDTKGSLLGVGSTHGTNGPANIPFSLKTFRSGTVQRE